LASWREREAEIADLAQRQLFFVGGAPRSGTTWVQHLLNGHPDVSCRGEGHFLQFLAAPMEPRRYPTCNAASLFRTQSMTLPQSPDAG
jgi:hypothetical protein